MFSFSTQADFSSCSSDFPPRMTLLKIWSLLITNPQKRNKKDLVGLLFVGKVPANQVLDVEYDIIDYT